MTSAPVDDPELVEAAQRGETGALDILLRRHHPRLMTLCVRLTGPSDADDACQEALLAIARGLGRFDGRSSFATWAYRVTTNTCLDELRRRRRRPQPGLPDDAPGGPDAGRVRRAVPLVGPLGPDDAGDTAANRVDIDTALSTLAPEFRAAVVLRDLCQLSYAEIADVVDVPVGTVRSRIARGRASLLPLLADAPMGNRVASGNPTTPAERPTP